MEKLIILHTNDLHSHLENWPKIRRFLRDRKAENAHRQNSVITVDLGDFIDRWHPLTEATNGQANVELMNEIAYDAATIGNNEGVGNSKEQLNHLYDHANFDVILDNLFDQKTLQPPAWAHPSKIITTESGTKVGLLACTAPFPLTYSPNGWDIRQPLEILPDLVKDLRPQVDVLVLMSHLGVEADHKIAEIMPEFDVILGSHTHHLFEYGKKVAEVQLAAAGKFGQYVGEVQIELNDQHEILRTGARAFSTAEMLALPEDQTEINNYLELGHRLLRAEKIAWLPYALEQDSESEHSMLLATLAAVKEKGQTEASILNTGLFLTGINQGIVDQDELHTALPHPMHLIKVTLKGSDLIRLVFEMEKNRHFLRNFPMMGMGFRGKVFGEIAYSGIRFDRINRKVYWQNQPVDETQEYTFTTVDHFMFIPFFPTIELAGKCEFIFPEFIRSVLGEYLHAHYPIK